jgi:transposase
MGRRHLRDGTIPMERVREVLRLWELGLKQRAIHRSTGLARSSIQEYLRVAEQQGVTHAVACSMTDGALKAALGKSTPGRAPKELNEGAAPDFGKLHGELVSRKGMTLELLWKEWNDATGGGWSYSTFCRRYNQHALRHAVVLRRSYEPGEMLLSDYSGETLSRSSLRHSVRVTTPTSKQRRPSRLCTG